jgi:hypothetical protein
MQKTLLFLLLIISTLSAQSQIKYPIGYWVDHLPYGNPIRVVQSSEKIFCATEVSVYSVNKADNSIERISKCNGLSDIGFNDIAYDEARGNLIIAYSNSNIDFWNNGEVFNLSDLKKKNLSGDKSIYHIYVKNDFAYLSCGFGITVIDLNKKEFKDTYLIGTIGGNLKVNEITTSNNIIYAASDSGLYTADANSNFLNNFTEWTRLGATQLLPSKKFTHVITASNGNVFASDNTGKIYQYNNSSWSLALNDTGFLINRLYEYQNKLYVCAINNVDFQPKIDKLNINDLTNEEITANDIIRFPTDIIIDETQKIWLADFYVGLHTTLDLIAGFPVFPNGPLTKNVFEIASYNGNVYVAPGGINSDGGPATNRDGIFYYLNNQWFYLNGNNYALLKDTLLDFVSVEYDSKNDIVYYTSFAGGGLLEFKNNSISTYKQGFIGKDPNFYNYPVFACKLDPNGNLWMTNPTNSKPIRVKLADGNWKSFNVQGISTTDYIRKIFTDRFNQVWITITGDGIVVYNYGDDVSSTADDQFRKLGKGVGKGNLPDLNVRDMVLDNNDEMWIGTDKGIAVVYCPFDMFSSNICDAQQIIVEGTDSIAGYLLESEVVTAIDIDAGNRKWVGTLNGVFLLSEDGTKTIAHYTSENSPLFSNTIVDLKFDAITGLVFIGTENGLMAFQSDASIPNTTKPCEIFVYPNPVEEKYTGLIAFNNLPYNATVKVVDASGKLVYQTSANGGTATWTGINYEGEKAHSGVYFVSATSSDGSLSCLGKFIFIK